jgi:hypothetical protein
LPEDGYAEEAFAEFALPEPLELALAGAGSGVFCLRNKFVKVFILETIPRALAPTAKTLLIEERGVEKANSRRTGVAACCGTVL